MKTIIAIILASVALALSGCSSTISKNAGTFLNSVKSMGIVANDVSQKTSTPIYSHTESATGIAKLPNGDITITNLRVGIAIPLWGTTWDLAASGIQITAPDSKTIIIPPVIPPTTSAKADPNSLTATVAGWETKSP